MPFPARHRRRAPRPTRRCASDADRRTRDVPSLEVNSIVNTRGSFFSAIVEEKGGGGGEGRTCRKSETQGSSASEARRFGRGAGRQDRTLLGEVAVLKGERNAKKTVEDVDNGHGDTLGVVWSSVLVRTLDSGTCA